MTQWYLRKNASLSGPHDWSSIEQLAVQGEIAPGDEIKSGEWSEWRPARAVLGEELVSAAEDAESLPLPDAQRGQGDPSPATGVPASSFLGACQGIFAVLKIVQVPLIVAILAALFLVLPAQTIEIYRAMAQEIFAFDEPHCIAWALREHGMELDGVDPVYCPPESFNLAFSEAVYAFAAVIAMGIALWFVTRLMTISHHRLIPKGSRVTETAIAWVPSIVGAVPIIAAARGIYSAQLPHGHVDDLFHRYALNFVSNFIGRDENVAVFREVLENGKAFTDVEHYNEGLALVNESFFAKQILSGSNEILAQAALICLGAAFVFLLVTRLIGRKSTIRTADRSQFFGRRTRILIYVFVAGVSLFFTFSPVGPAQTVGSIPVFGLFIVCLALISGQISFLSHKYKVPFLGSLVLFGAALSYFDVNDNHMIREAEPEPAPQITVADIPTVDRQFPAWLEERHDWDEKCYSTEIAATELPEGCSVESEYPVYIVAAQGGGIYAAVHVLSALYDIAGDCPGFMRHVFAISGVSGGAVGSALYSSASSRIEFDAGKHPNNPCLFRENDDYVDAAQIRHLITKKYLAPLFAGMLFPDFAQRFIPFPIPAFDRARFLEKAFEASWNPDDGINPLAKSYLQHWDPAGDSPALLFNTTEVSSGRRRLISPFLFCGGSDLQFLPVWNNRDLKDRVNPTLSAAAGLSARFPWLTPTGFFMEHTSTRRALEAASCRKPVPNTATNGLTGEKPQKISLADGGYFENSGVATAHDLIKEINRISADLKLRIRPILLILTTGGYPGHATPALEEISAPIKALLNTRSAKAVMTIADAETSLPPDDILKLRLDGEAFKLPLGWRLSPATQAFIYMQMGFIQDCQAFPVERQLDYAECVRERITADISAIEREIVPLSGSE